MLTLDQMRQQLVDRRLQVVAEATGLHYNTLKDIRDNPAANPSWRVMVALSQYLGGDDATKTISS